MARRLLPSIASALCVLALTASSPATAAPKKVHVGAGVDLEPEEAADRYLAANLKLVEKDLPEAIRVCAKSAEAGQVADFELAVEVGKGGKAGKSVTTPTNAFTGCVAKAVGAMKFTEPPRTPLGVYFEVYFRE